jgi:uncharacterized membrane protein
MICMSEKADNEDTPEFLDRETEDSGSGSEFEAETAPGEGPRIVRRRGSKRLPSAVSGREFKKRDMVLIDSIRPSLSDRIRQDFPNLPPDAYISESELARYRMLYVEELLQKEHGEFTELDRQVAESIANQDTVAENTEDEFEDNRTVGEVLSDRLADFGGSWAFLIIFAMVLVVWMAINALLGNRLAFDPFPFILLNLVLSCIAAIQAPVIMMSQKRQESKDRLRANNDYRVNLKAELEVRHLHEKLDYLVSRQWQRLAEIQQMQLEIMQAKSMRKDKRASGREPGQDSSEDGSARNGRGDATGASEAESGGER